MKTLEQFLKDNYTKEFTQTDLVEKLNVSKATVSRKIKQLLQSNKIIITKRGKFNYIKYSRKPLTPETFTQSVQEFNQSVHDTLIQKNTFTTQTNNNDISSHDNTNTIKKLQNEIKQLKHELLTTKLSKQYNYLSFSQFTNFIMSKARKTGSNSYRWGEICFRRSDLKNIYLIHLKIIDNVNNSTNKNKEVNKHE